MISLQDCFGPDYEEIAKRWTETRGVEFRAADVKSAMIMAADFRTWEEFPPPLESDEWKG
jgi:hypothetical protein